MQAPPQQPASPTPALVKNGLVHDKNVLTYPPNCWIVFLVTARLTERIGNRGSLLLLDKNLIATITEAIGVVLHVMRDHSSLTDAHLDQSVLKYPGGCALVRKAIHLFSLGCPYRLLETFGAFAELCKQHLPYWSARQTGERLELKKLLTHNYHYWLSCRNVPLGPDGKGKVIVRAMSNMWIHIPGSEIVNGDMFPEAWFKPGLPPPLPMVKPPSQQPLLRPQEHLPPEHPPVQLAGAHPHFQQRDCCFGSIADSDEWSYHNDDLQQHFPALHPSPYPMITEAALHQAVGALILQKLIPNPFEPPHTVPQLQLTPADTHHDDCCPSAFPPEGVASPPGHHRATKVTLTGALLGASQSEDSSSRKTGPSISSTLPRFGGSHQLHHNTEFIGPFKVSLLCSPFSSTYPFPSNPHTPH